MSLKAHQVVDAAVGIIPAQLYHGVGPAPRPGIVQSPGLQRPVEQCVVAPAGHDLHGHTALKYLLVLKAVDRGLFGGGQSLPKGIVLRLRHGAVDIIRRTLAVAGAHPRGVHIHAVRRNQRRGSVVEMQGTVLTQK
ncbi:hypothetical protein SDC9_160159 [bioreactor metagenome]|uniref:Uncharacterized protein n=1 Tax=bioreactor metagenome TaxID=1076179 RepID=A0A645FHL6_9ZZZZ